VGDGVFDGESHRLGGVGLLQDGPSPRRDGFEGPVERDFLERAGPEDLRADPSGEGEHGGTVDDGVPAAGEQVRGSGSGDGEAGRWTARQLAVRRSGEGGGALVPDP